MEYISIIKNQSFEIAKINKFEGEILDIKVNKMSEYHIGDSISCVYLGVRFHTKILRKNDSLISIFVSMDHTHFPNEKRKTPRIPVVTPLLINDNMEENVYYTKPVKEGTVIDVSINGVGFLSTKKLSISPHPYYLYIEMENTTIRVEVIVKHEKVLENKYQYGSEIQFISEKDYRILLRYILINQLKTTFTEEELEQNNEFIEADDNAETNNETKEEKKKELQK